MTQPSSPRSRLAARLLLLASLVGGTTLSVCQAEEPAALASVVIDADSAEVLHAVNANRRVRPASLTKLMTALLVMQHLALEENDAQQKWRISSRAAAQPASHLGLLSGHEITASQVLDAVLVPSANDAAVVAAEAIAGDEASFAQRMNEVAAQLGMSRTRFANASGLPAAQFTTARDIAVLALHLWRSFPAQRKRFAQSGINHAGRWRGTTNPLLGSYRGARGMKTGFTCRAGFHLVGAAQRDGRTLIAVVLGTRTPQARIRSIRKLLDDAFKTQPGAATMNIDALAEATGQGDRLPVSVKIIADTCLYAGRAAHWSIDVGVARSKKQARARARKFLRTRRKTLPGARATSIPRHRGVTLHRAIITGINEKRARAACLQYRKEGGACIIFGPKVAAAQVEEAARIRTLAKIRRAEKAAARAAGQASD